MNDKEQKRRYELAQSLHSLFEYLCATDMEVDEKYLDALMDAAQIVSPEYIAGFTKELERGMNDPEIIAAVEEAKKTPGYQAALELIKQRRKELGWDK